MHQLVQLSSVYVGKLVFSSTTIFLMLETIRILSEDYV